MTSPTTARTEIVRTETMAWVPTGPGKSFRPLHFGEDHWSEIMRLEPGAEVPLHRHTGDVHAFTVAGARRLGTGEDLGPGDYHHEPAGTIDAWQAIGDRPCIVHLVIGGAVEYLDPDGEITGKTDSASQAAIYRQWCALAGAAAARALGEPGR